MEGGKIPPKRRTYVFRRKAGYFRAISVSLTNFYTKMFDMGMELGVVGRVVNLLERLKGIHEGGGVVEAAGHGVFLPTSLEEFAAVLAVNADRSVLRKNDECTVEHLNRADVIKAE